jgi:hypothetical protein
VVLPDDGFRDYTEPVFPQGTVEFLHFLREHAPSGTAVEIAIEDADYHEVVLHHDIVRLATLFVEYAAAPIVTSVIAAYLKDWLGNRFTNAEVRATIIVKRKDGAAEQEVRISYEGPAPTFEKSVSDAMAGLVSPTRVIQSDVPKQSEVTQQTKMIGGRAAAPTKKRGA